MSEEIRRENEIQGISDIPGNPHPGMLENGAPDINDNGVNDEYETLRVEVMDTATTSHYVIYDVDGDAIAYGPEVTSQEVNDEQLYEAAEDSVAALGDVSGYERSGIDLGSMTMQKGPFAIRLLHDDADSTADAFQIFNNTELLMTMNLRRRSTGDIWNDIEQNIQGVYMAARNGIVFGEQDPQVYDHEMQYGEEGADPTSVYQDDVHEEYIWDVGHEDADPGNRVADDATTVTGDPGDTNVSNVETLSQHPMLENQNIGETQAQQYMLMTSKLFESLRQQYHDHEGNAPIHAEVTGWITEGDSSQEHRIAMEYREDESGQSYYSVQADDDHGHQYREEGNDPSLLWEAWLIASGYGLYRKMTDLIPAFGYDGLDVNEDASNIIDDISGAMSHHRIKDLNFSVGDASNIEISKRSMFRGLFAERIPGVVVRINGEKMTRSELEDFINAHKESFVLGYNEAMLSKLQALDQKDETDGKYARAFLEVKDYRMVRESIRKGEQKPTSPDAPNKAESLATIAPKTEEPDMGKGQPSIEGQEKPDTQSNGLENYRQEHEQNKPSKGEDPRHVAPNGDEPEHDVQPPNLLTEDVRLSLKDRQEADLLQTEFEKSTILSNVPEIKSAHLVVMDKILHEPFEVTMMAKYTPKKSKTRQQNSTEFGQQKGKYEVSYLVGGQVVKTSQEAALKDLFLQNYDQMKEKYQIFEKEYHIGREVEKDLFHQLRLRPDIDNLKLQVGGRSLEINRNPSVDHKNTYTVSIDGHDASSLPHSGMYYAMLGGNKESVTKELKRSLNAYHGDRIGYLAENVEVSQSEKDRLQSVKHEFELNTMKGSLTGLKRAVITFEDGNPPAKYDVQMQLQSYDRTEGNDGRSYSSTKITYLVNGKPVESTQYVALLQLIDRNRNVMSQQFDTLNRIDSDGRQISSSLTDKLYARSDLTDVSLKLNGHKIEIHRGEAYQNGSASPMVKITIKFDGREINRDETAKAAYHRFLSGHKVDVQTTFTNKLIQHASRNNETVVSKRAAKQVIKEDVSKGKGKGKQIVLTSLEDVDKLYQKTVERKNLDKDKSPELMSWMVAHNIDSYEKLESFMQKAVMNHDIGSMRFGVDGNVVELNRSFTANEKEEIKEWFQEHFAPRNVAHTTVHAANQAIVKPAKKFSKKTIEKLLWFAVQVTVQYPITEATRGQMR